MGYPLSITPRFDAFCIETGRYILFHAKPSPILTSYKLQTLLTST